MTPDPIILTGMALITVGEAAGVAWVTIHLVVLAWLIWKFIKLHIDHTRKMREIDRNASIGDKAVWELRHGNQAEAERLLAIYNAKMDQLWKEINTR